MIVPIDILSQLLFESMNPFSLFKRFFGTLNIQSPRSKSVYNTNYDKYA